MTLAFKEYGPPDAQRDLPARRQWVDVARPVVKRLQAEFHCLVPDLPGHGESAALAWRSPEDGPAFQRLLTAVMLPLMHTDYYVRSTAQLLRLPIDTMRRVLRALTTFQMAELAAPPPLLFMAGADENREIVGRLDGFKALYPGAQTEVVPGAQHAWPGEQPEVLAQRIRALLDTSQR